MTVVPVTTTGGASATSVGLPSLDFSTRLPPVSSVLVSGQSTSEALTALLSVCSTAESAVVPGIDVSSAVPPNLSEIVPGNFDISVEPHGGEACTTSPGEENAAEGEKRPSCKLCACCFAWFFFYCLSAIFFWTSSFSNYHDCVVEGISFPEDKCEIHGVFSEVKKDNTSPRT